MSATRRHLERLRKMSHGVLGDVPGSVPVSASRNGGYVPSSVPVLESTPYRAPVQGDFPTVGVGESPRFSWPGLMDSLDESPEWRMGSAQTFDEVAVDFTTNDDVIEFDIKVNGAIIESIVCGVGMAQEFAVNVVVVRDDKVTLATTNFASGLAEDTAVTLRRAV